MRIVYPFVGSLWLLLCSSMLTGCGSTPVPDPIPKHDTFLVESEVLKEARTINVYVPPMYASGDDVMPVVYMLDGGLAEDFPHIANTLESLMTKGEISPVILVGIENTERRRDLTGPTTVESDKKVAPQVGGSAAFRTFIRDELMPEVLRRYRCSDDTAIVGESVAGLFVTETFLLEPALFDRYIAMDPSLWWNDMELARNATSHLQAMDSTERCFWFASSSATDIVGPAKKLEEALNAATPSGLRWTYDPRPSEKHSTIFRATKEDAFRWALQNPQDH